MGCKGCWECLLKLLNFLMTLAGLAMVGYGIYLLVQYNNQPDDNLTVPSDQTLVQLGRPMLVAVNLSDSIFDNLPKAWFIYAFIGVGAILFVISCFGCIASVTRNECCLSCYAFLVILLILLELAFAAFMFFDEGWKKEIPQDETGYFDMVYGFLRENWDIVRWVALGIVVFEAVLFFLALIVRAANKQADYDSDEEYINPRHQARQPLLTNKPASPVTGVPVSGTLDQRSSRTDAWSTRMREKYGLDTSEFTYNPSESHRFQQPNPQPTEERSRCTIM
ncbi:Tobamovirus multiplication protein 2A [Stylosanthes scabra]|uniref:Tobamovirus multiplication protein 2A n=1 Tax=Stylosanthes scabra TaxID=79078 RepID=A0ABU6X714_9FABA|nr:Tobamovirus multiplication protein 2A [Stylosanthes scabra]